MSMSTVLRRSRGVADACGVPGGKTFGYFCVNGGAVVDAFKFHITWMD